MIKNSILCDPLPCEISFGGEIYPVMTDFRRWILLVTLMSDERADFSMKSRLAVKLVLGDIPLPEESGKREETLLGLMREIMRFALCGASENDGCADGEQSFDFEYDAELIFASFMQAYGIDLTSAEMHWWKFMALLRRLPPDSPLLRVMEIRMADTSSVEDDGMRKRLRRAKAAVRIRRGYEED